MAEIRANREYKFKELCISEEIPKSPPIKTKRWTFHDTNPDSRFYMRPMVQRKGDLITGSGRGNWSAESNANQLFVKPFKKPESDLRAEFFNAYKKYYRRVDIKRVEVQSTLNVDAKFKGTDESADGESSLYKEKECMEINIVMDTEKDDALVSSQVRRTVLCVSPGEDGICGKENRSGKMVIGVPGEVEVGDHNIILGRTAVGEPPYCSSAERSGCRGSDHPVPSEQNYPNQEKHLNLVSRLKEEDCSVARTFAGLSSNSNNALSNSGKDLLQSSEKESILNHERLTFASCNDIAPKADALENDPRSSAWSPPTPMVGGKESTVKGTGVDGLIKKYEKNEYVKRVENRFCKSNMEQNTKYPVGPNPFIFQNPVEKSTKSEIFQNRKNNFKRSMNLSNNNCEDVGMTSSPAPAEENFAPLTFDKFRPNPFICRSVILQDDEKMFNIDSNSINVDQYGPKSDHDENLPARKPMRKHHTNQSHSEGYNLEGGATASIRTQDKNISNIISVPGTESAGEACRTKCLEQTKTYLAPKTEENVSNSESGIKFRGLRGAPFKESNPKVLKSLVVNVIQSDPNDDENVRKRDSNMFCQNLNRRLQKKDTSDLERNDVYFTCSKKFHTSSPLIFCEPVNSRYQKLEVPQTFQNVTKRSGSSSNIKNLCSVESSCTSGRTEKIEEPFVIWTNKNRRDPSESPQINKLTVFDNDSEIESDYDTNSNLQSFSEISGIGKKQLKNNKQDYQRHSQNTEKKKEKTYFRNVSKTTIGNEVKDNAWGGKRAQFPEGRYTSFANKNSALPNSGSHDESLRVLNSKCVKEDQKSEIGYKRDAVSFDEKEDWIGDTSRSVSQNHLGEELQQIDKKQRFRKHIIPKVCVTGESQLSERAIRTYDKNTNTDGSNRIRNGQQEDKEKIIFSQQLSNEDNVLEQRDINFHESSGCDKQISKSSNSDFLQIGPTYSVHYTPVHKKVLRTAQQKNYDETWETEKIYECCHGGSVNALYCDHGNAANFIHKKRNETLSRNGFNHSTSLYCGNSLKMCRNDIVCNAYHNPNNEINSCGYRNTDEINCCYCEGHNRGQSHRIMKSNNVCPCQDANLYCQYRSRYNCPMRNKHHTHVCRPCQDGNRDYCQECGNGDEQRKFLFKECSTNFQKSNNFSCFCPPCSTEIRTDVALTRKEICCGACTGDEQVNICPLRFNDEGHWMSTGHQPFKNSNKCSVEDLTHMEQIKESSTSIQQPPTKGVKEPFMKGFENHPPVNSLHNDNPLYYEERSSARNHIRNDSYIYDKEIENMNVCQKSSENVSDGNNSVMDIKTERKDNHSPVISEGVTIDFQNLVDNSAIQEGFKMPIPKLTPGERVYDVKETDRFSNEGKQLSIKDPINSYDRKTNVLQVPLKGRERCKNEPLFLCEEQWDSDDGLPMRRIIRKVEERNEEKEDSSDFENEPIYLREEHWQVDDEETGVKKVFRSNFRSSRVGHPNDSNYFWKGRRWPETQSAGRKGNFSEGGDSRKCSSVHAVSDPSFYCEEQWASDEEKCEDHKFQSTLPKNSTKKKKGRDRRSFNPRRWDMVTDLPKNDYIGEQNHYNFGQNEYEGDNFGDNVVSKNRSYYSNYEL